MPCYASCKTRHREGHSHAGVLHHEGAGNAHDRLYFDTASGELSVAVHPGSGDMHMDLPSLPPDDPLPTGMDVQSELVKVGNVA
jgi:predicted PhzF superfamily epimerase YddE/YHI9